MLDLDPFGALLIRPNAKDELIERGQEYMMELLHQGTDGAIVGISLFGFVPDNVNVINLYHDLYNIYYNKRVKMRCTLEAILRSMLDDTMSPKSEYLDHVYKIGFVRYIIKLVKDSGCSIVDLHNVALRRSTHVEEDTLKNMFFNALGWLDNESYWYLFRNKIGIDKGIKSMGMVVPKDIRMNKYITDSYMFSYVIAKGPRKTFLKTRPDEHVCNSDQCLTDVDIISKYNLIPNYTNKRELVDLLSNIRRDRMYQVSNTDDYIGQETSISMNIVCNTDILVLYNGLNYTLDEIRECCNNGMRLDRPFSIVLAKDIRTIMDRCNDLEMVKALDHYIETNIDELIIMKEYLKHNEEFNAILRGLVEMGLYARRWRGHGFQYPYSALDTVVENSTFRRNMDLVAIQLNKLFIRNVHIRNMLLMYKDYGTTRAKLFPNYALMIEGKLCIREMSNALIHTGIHYLDKIFGTPYMDNSSQVLDVTKIQFMNPIAPEELRRLNSTQTH